MAPRFEADGKGMSIDHDACDGDSACADVCPADVFVIEDGKSNAVNIAECTECCACVSACPNDAIKHDSC